MNDNKEYKLSSDETKVVKLHKDLSNERVSDIAESINIAKQMKIDTCEDITELCMEQFLSMCTTYGIFMDPNRFDHRDLMMVENAITASLYRHYGLKHPMHEVTEDMFREEEIEDLTS